MLIILPISASGGLGYLTSGNLDFTIFLQTVAGLMIGAFISSKFTHLAPKPILKFAIVAMPTIGGLNSFIIPLNKFCKFYYLPIWIYLW